jgi:hypothetical protein
MAHPEPTGRPRRWQSLFVAVAVAGAIAALTVWRVSGPGTASVRSGISSPSASPASPAPSSAPASSKKAAPTTTTAPPHPVNADTVTYDVPSDVTSDCSSDVTTPLLDWIDSTPDNSVLRFGTNACYEIEGVLYVKARHKLTFVGNGAHFLAKTNGADQPQPVGATDPRWPRRRAQWWFVASSDISISNMTLTGSNPYSGRADAQYDRQFEVQSGFVIAASTNVTVADNTIEKVWGDFVTVEDRSSNVTIRGNRMTTNGRQGVAVTNADHVVIDGNTMDDMRRSVFDLEVNLDSGSIDDVRIINNTTGNSTNLFVANAGNSTRVSNIVIQNNTMTGTSLAVLYSKTKDPSVGRRGPWTIDHNHFRMRDTTWAGFEWIGSVGISLHDNVVTIDPGANITMVRTSSSDQLQVHDNDFTGTAVLLDPGDTPTWCEANNQPAALSHNRPC